MIEQPLFSGFPEETVQFLIDLRDHNERGWFAQHKQNYVNYIQTPAQSFSAVMAHSLETSLPPILASHRIKSSIFRIYRDTRFSEDKTPYKTHLGIWFWQGDLQKTENSGFYFQLEPPNLILAVGIYMFSKHGLLTYRNSVTDVQSGAELNSAIQAVLQRGEYTLGGKHYQRVPRGYDPDHPQAELLLYNGLYFSNTKPFPPSLHSSDFIDYCLEKFLDMLPLHSWLFDMLVLAKT